MIANIYIDSSSLSYASGESRNSVKCRLTNFFTYCFCIRSGGDKIYCSNDIFEINIFDDFKLEDIFTEKRSFVDPDERKLLLTFKFKNDQGALESVYCEPHMKMPHRDKEGDSSYSTDRRIYFHEGKANIHGGKILIGWIGKHL